MSDGPDEADDGDGEEEDATGSDPPNDGERFHLIGSLSVGCDANQDEAHQLLGRTIFSISAQLIMDKYLTDLISIVLLRPRELRISLTYSTHYRVNRQVSNYTFG